MSTRPTETFMTFSTPSGNFKTVKRFSYVVTLCHKGSDEVTAARFDGFGSKYDQDFRNAVSEAYPEDEWFVKNILKLYDSDFEKGAAV